MTAEVFNVPTMNIRYTPGGGHYDTGPLAAGKWGERGEALAAFEFMSALLGNATPFRVSRIIGLPQPKSAYRWRTGQYRPSSKWLCRMIVALQLIHSQKVNPKEVEAIIWDVTPPKLIMRANSASN